MINSGSYCHGTSQVGDLHRHVGQVRAAAIAQLAASVVAPTGHAAASRCASKMLASGYLQHSQCTFYCNRASLRQSICSSPRCAQSTATPTLSRSIGERSAERTVLIGRNEGRVGTVEPEYARGGAYVQNLNRRRGGGSSTDSKLTKAVVAPTLDSSIEQ